MMAHRSESLAAAVSRTDLWMNTTFMSQHEYNFSQNAACSPRKGFFSLKGRGAGGNINSSSFEKKQLANLSLFPLPCVPSGRC